MSKTNNTVTTIVYKDMFFKVHMVPKLGGYEGFVVFEGDFFCSLPNTDTKTKLLDSADARIKDIIDTPYGIFS